MTALSMCAAGFTAWLLALRWTAIAAPQVTTGRIRAAVQRHPRLAATVESRLDPSVTTGLALTAASAIVVVGVVGFGLLLLMVRTNIGFAHFDQAAARFAGRHAGAASTSVLRYLTQLGGAVVLVPVTAVVAMVAVWRYRSASVVVFLLFVVGGQFAVADLIKWIVDRGRPNIDRLTGFSGPSFPSGHAVAAAATFGAFALLAGIGRPARAKAALAAAAVALAVGIACTRLFLGVHWLTDVLAGLALGWAWFALCSIGFGGRLLNFGAPVKQAQEAAEAAEDRRATVSPSSSRS
ncbi:MAG: phosphatase PAP2 family protein [Actinomycetota bacterium]|nr:phosphatase PAP2 family protein [Actinomycetota bacterium]